MLRFLCLQMCVYGGCAVPQGGVGDRHLVTVPQGVVGDRLPQVGERQGGGGTGSSHSIADGRLLFSASAPLLPVHDFRILSNRPGDQGTGLRRMKTTQPSPSRTDFSLPLLTSARSCRISFLELFFGRLSLPPGAALSSSDLSPLESSSLIWRSASKNKNKNKHPRTAVLYRLYMP